MSLVYNIRRKSVNLTYNLYHKMFRALTKFSTKIYKPRYRYYVTHTTVTKNGIRLAVEETNSPVACVSLFAHAGPRFETDDNNGISHFIEHIACMGFEIKDSKRLEDCLNSIGARLTATTTREYQSFSGLVPVEKTSELINIMSLILTNLDLRESNIEMEKQNMLMELEDYDKSPKLIVFDYLHQAAFQGTPLAQNVIGPTENIKGFDENCVNAFLKQQYRPDNLVLAVSGAVQHIEVINEAQKRLANIPCAAPGPKTYDIHRYTGCSLVYRDDSMPYAHVAAAIEVCGYEDPDFWPLFVANCISGHWHRSQGGDDGHGSYLAQAAATQECEYFETFYFAYQEIGLWGVYFVAGRNNLEHFLLNIQSQWVHLSTSITEPELQRGINYAKFKLARQIEGSFNSSRDVGFQMLYTCSSLSLFEKYKKVHDVTVSRIKEIGQKYIYDKCPVVAAIGPTECLPEYAGVRSRMYWLRY